MSDVSLTGSALTAESPILMGLSKVHESKQENTGDQQTSDETAQLITWNKDKEYPQKVCISQLLDRSNYPNHIKTTWKRRY
jgi:hypothetical protein